MSTQKKVDPRKLFAAFVLVGLGLLLAYQLAGRVERSPASSRAADTVKLEHTIDELDKGASELQGDFDTSGLDQDIEHLQ